MQRHLSGQELLQPQRATHLNGSSHDERGAVAGGWAPPRLTKLGWLTVLVPTRNERGNIAPLLARLAEVSRAVRFTVLFIDDSTDGTPEVIRELAANAPFPVDVLHRPPENRAGGLGGAVRAGLGATDSKLVCVMDADMQHPPELLPALVAEARRSNAEVVVASRYRDSCDLAGFPAARRALSRGSELMARVLFPRRLRRISDPMSGFFLVRRTAIDVGAMRPRGFKILLEILLSGPRLSTSEVGFQFGERYAGESKATLREGGRYLRQLVGLRVFRWNRAGKPRSTVSQSMPMGAVDANASC